MALRIYDIGYKNRVDIDYYNDKKTYLVMRL